MTVVKAARWVFTKGHGEHVPDGLAVRILGSHPGGPGSTSGQGASVPFHH